MADLLITLINASERAACIARSCCFESSKEVLLVAEKCDGEANTRFERDFKTIADVLAQEAAKSEISIHFPELANNIRGEECSEISGVPIALQENSEKTAELLSSLVPSNVAKGMAQAAHGAVNLQFCDKLPTNIPAINTSDLGIWIDPIDATAEFIAGVRGEANPDHGLPCVTVLIGAYLISTGEPVLGVINQPFFNNGKGRIVWGVTLGDTQEWGVSDMETHSESNIVLMSGAEKAEVMEKVSNLGCNVKSVPGAGNKLLKVALGEAAAYIVSQGTTFRWDTCAPHSILKAKGGDLLNYTTQAPILYNDPKGDDTQFYCNSEGIIAFSDPTVFDKLKTILN